VSPRRVDGLLQALGLTGIDTPALAGGARESRVSRICKELDEVVEPFRNRPLEGQYPFVWLDALYLKVRHNHRIVSQALVIATGVRESGEREVLGFALGASEEEAFWLDFLPEGHRDGVRSLVRRGLKGGAVGHQRRPRRPEEGVGAGQCFSSSFMEGWRKLIPRRSRS